LPTALLLVLVTAGGAVLRFAGIGDKSLWIDEAFSVHMARLPLTDMWRITVDLDFHPPLYYAVLHAWLALGDGEVAVRSLSAVLSVLTLPLVFLIGQRLGGRALGLVSSGLVAVSPLQIAYAQQARMYALLTFWAAVSILCVVVLMDRPDSAVRRPLPWAVFAGSTTLAMLSHNTAVLLPVAIALFVAVVLTRSALGHPGPAVGSWREPLHGAVGVATGLGAALVLWLPWLPFFSAQSHRVDREFWIEPPTLSTVLEHWHDLVNAYGPEGNYRNPEGNYRNYVLVGVLALVVLGMAQLRGRPEGTLLLVLLVVVPVAVELLISIRRPIFYTQTLVWTSIPFSLLLAAGILRLRQRPLIALVTALVLVLNAVGIRGYLQYDGKEQWRTAVQYVADSAHPDELVLFSAGWAQIPFDYYYARSGGPPITRRGIPADELESGVLEAKMTDADLSRIDELTRGRSTVWLVYSHDWYTDPSGRVPSRLSTAFHEDGSRELAGIRVVHYRAGSD
jgi:uncharacterized membrane protein